MICPYCKGNDTVKRGIRKKKHETVQLFFCTLRTWLTDYADYLPFLRMRDFIFRESTKRASEYRDSFNPDGVRFVRKTNSACRLARLVVDAVANPKLRHQMLERFLLLNDSVTVAVEVPVLLDGSDIHHFRNDLAFAVPVELSDDEVVTGHADIIQIRNGSVHILDYKPSAAKEKPIDQLTLYALALSRLTGLRLYHFKCAWFDEEEYFEFYPLHVLHAAGAAYVPLPAYATPAP